MKRDVEHRLPAHRDDEPVTFRSVISTPELARTCGLSYRQVDRWIREGVLVPLIESPGSGGSRPFSESEARIARVLAALRSLGAPLEVLIVVAAQLRDWTDVDWYDQLLHVSPESGIVPCTRMPSACWTVDLAALALDRVRS